MLDSDLAPRACGARRRSRVPRRTIFSRSLTTSSTFRRSRPTRWSSQNASPFDLVSIVEGVVDIVAVAGTHEGGCRGELHRSAGPARGPRRPAAAAPGAGQPGRERGQVHRSGEVVVRAERLPSPRPAGARASPSPTPASGSRRDAIETLFEPFTQVEDELAAPERRQRARPGDLLAPGAVDGRKLAVDSEVGRGSMFSFTLPFSMPEGAGRGARFPPTDRGAAAAGHRRRPLRRTSAETMTLRAGLGGWCRHVCPTIAEARAGGRRACQRALRRGDHRRPRDEAEAPQLARELHAQAGEDGMFVARASSTSASGWRRMAAREPRRRASTRSSAAPIKQSRLYDALVGHLSPTRHRPPVGRPPTSAASRAADPDRRGQPGQPAGPAAPGTAARDRGRQAVGNGAGGARRARAAASTTRS